MAGPSPYPPTDRDFLAGGGEAERLIRARDWNDHPLGPPDHWPDTLRTAVSLVLNSPESIILGWGEALFCFFNDTYIPLLGPRAPWAMGEPFETVWADGWEQARPIIVDAMAGRSQRFENLPWKLDTDRGAAETFWSFSYSRILDPAGQPVGLFVLTNETTEQVATDAALTRSQTELTAINATLERRVAERTAEIDRLWDTSPDLLVSLTPEGVLQRVNPAWTETLGYAPEALLGRSVVDLIHPDDVEASRRALETTRVRPLPSFENRYRHADGSYRWIAWVAAPNPSEIFATGRHVTAQKEAEAGLRRAEEQLRQSARIEAIGHLTGGMAHDFNNLLTVIQGSVDLLRRGRGTEERRARHIDAIADAAERATRLTSQLLAFGRRQSLIPETFSLSGALGDLRGMLATLLGPQIDLVLDTGEVERFAHADRSQFDAAIVNMTANARDAMDGAGRLQISVGTADAIPAVRAHPRRSGTFATVTLCDTGAGMTSAAMERIFEPFFSTKGVGQGNGLGLSQVIGFAKQSSGDVAVQSSPGEGATFTLYLPVVAANRAAAVSRTPMAAEPQGCVLVVEDDPEVGRFAIQALEAIGHGTVLVTDGAAALAELDLGADRFVAVFSDVVMPRMSGIDLAEAVRRNHPDMPILLTSGYSAVLAEEGSHGFDLVRKPYSIEALAAALAHVIARASPETTVEETRT